MLRGCVCFLRGRLSSLLLKFFRLEFRLRIPLLPANHSCAARFRRIIPRSALSTRYAPRKVPLFSPAMHAKNKTEDTAKAIAAGASNPSEGAMCAICSKPAKVRYCSRECRLIAKVQRTRAQRPLKDHICVCRRCGKAFPVGRPRRSIPNQQTRQV